MAFPRGRLVLGWRGSLDLSPGSAAWEVELNRSHWRGEWHWRLNSRSSGFYIIFPLCCRWPGCGRAAQIKTRLWIRCRLKWAEWEMCFWWSEESKRASGDYVLEKYWINNSRPSFGNGPVIAHWALLIKAFNVITGKLQESLFRGAHEICISRRPNRQYRFRLVPLLLVPASLRSRWHTKWMLLALFWGGGETSQAAKCQAIVCWDKDVRAAF